MIDMQLVSNKKAYFNYEIGDKMVAGIELLGTEVKSLRQGRASLEGSYIIVRGGEAFLMGADIPPFQAANTSPSYDQHRPRKLLLHKREIKEIADIESKKNQTTVPLAFFLSDNKIKLEVAITQSKKKFDKRETLKKRDTDREMRRELKR